MVLAALNSGGAALCPVGGACVYNEHGLFQYRNTGDDGFTWERVNPSLLASAANNGTNNSILTPHQQKALHCVGQAAAAKGVSIALDFLGSIPGFGNLFSGAVEGIQALNADYGTVALASAGNTLINPSASGAAFTGTSAALTVGSLVFNGSKVIPFVGTLVSLGSLAYDSTKAVQAYQQCMAGPG
jgi:hypothetical protein